MFEFEITPLKCGNEQLSGMRDIRSVRFTKTNQELGSCRVRGTEPKFGKLGTSYVVAVRFANIFIKFLSN